MQFTGKSVESISAIGIGLGALLFGPPATGTTETAIGISGLISSIRDSKTELSAELESVTQSCRKSVLSTFSHLLEGEIGSDGANADIEAADIAIVEAIKKGAFDQNSLKNCISSPKGFIESGTDQIALALGQYRPDLFDPENANKIPYQYLTTVARSALSSVFRNIEFYRKIEPGLVIEIGQKVGIIDRKLDKIEKKISELIIYEEIIKEKQKELSATRLEICSLLEYILNKKIPFDNIPRAITEAKRALDASRAEIANLQRIAGLSPNVSAIIAKASAALIDPNRLDLAAAQAALSNARREAQLTIETRRKQENLTLASLCSTEGELAFAQSNFFEANEHFSRASDYTSTYEPLQHIYFNIRRAESLHSYGELCMDIGALENAVSIFEEALDILTPDHNTSLWARAQSGLGNSSRILGQRFTGERSLSFLDKSIVAHRSALSVLDKAHARAEWSVSQNNLGNAYSAKAIKIVGPEKLEIIDNAVRSYDAALSVRSRDVELTDWAITKNNIGEILRIRALLEQGAEFNSTISEAIAALNDSSSCYKKMGAIKPAAVAQMNLAVVHSISAERSSGEEKKYHLKTAIDMYENLVPCFHPEEDAAQLGMILFNLASTVLNLSKLHDAKSPKADIEKSITLHQCALEIRTKERSPAESLMSQTSLASAKVELGRLLPKSEGLKYLKGVEETFSSILDSYSPDDDPLEWSSAQHVLGTIYMSAARSATDVEARTKLEAAQSCFRKCLEVRSESVGPVSWAHTCSNLADTITKLAQFEEPSAQKSMLQEAADLLETSSVIYRDNGMWFEEHNTKFNRGMNFYSLFHSSANRNDRLKSLDRAYDCFSRTKSICLEHGFGEFLPNSQTWCGICDCEIGALRNDITRLKRGIDVLEKNLDKYSENHGKSARVSIENLMNNGRSYIKKLTE